MMKKIQSRKVYVYVTPRDDKRQVREIERLVYKKLETVSLERGTYIINAVSDALSGLPVKADITLKKEHGKRTIYISLKSSK